MLAVILDDWFGLDVLLIREGLLHRDLGRDALGGAFQGRRNHVIDRGHQIPLDGCRRDIHRRDRLLILSAPEGSFSSLSAGWLRNDGDEAHEHCRA